MSSSFFEIKKLLPGIILGLVFVSAFAVGLGGFSGSQPVTSAPNPVLTQNGVANQVGVSPISTQVTSPAAEFVQAAPTSEPTEPIVTAEPVVASEPVQAAQPVPTKEQEQEKESEKRNSDKEERSNEKAGDD